MSAAAKCSSFLTQGERFVNRLLLNNTLRVQQSKKEKNLFFKAVFSIFCCFVKVLKEEKGGTQASAMRIYDLLSLLQVAFFPTLTKK